MQRLGHGLGLSKNGPLAKQIPEEVRLIHRADQGPDEMLGVDGDAIDVR
jgi:hypothetical protein